MATYSKETQRMNYRIWAKRNPERLKEIRLASARAAALRELEAAEAAGYDIVAIVKGTAEYVCDGCIVKSGANSGGDSL